MNPDFEMMSHSELVQYCAAMYEGPLSRRDQFAMVAMQGIWSCSTLTGSFKEIALRAYQQADAMIAESDKK